LKSKKQPKRYKIWLHKEVREVDGQQFDKRTKEKIKKKCRDLLSIHPEEVGESLHFELKNYRKLKIFNQYRIIYRIDKGRVIVFILAVGIRRDNEVYLEAIRRLSNPTL